MENSTVPKVSVVLPLFNAEKYVRVAIESILNQTFRDFELIIVNNASTDQSRKVVAEFSDPRIKIIDHPENLGLVASLNRGVSEARGLYLARMDADDIARADRFEKQTRYLDTHPETALVGSWFEYIGKDYVVKTPENSGAIRYFSLFNSPFGHPTVMFRREILADEKPPYRPEFNLAEDYELWCRLIDRFQTANIPEVLLDYRIHPQQISAGSVKQKEVADRIRLIQFRKMMGISSSAEGRLLLKILDQVKWKRPNRFLLKGWFLTVVARSILSGYLGPRYSYKFWKENRGKI